MDNSNDMTPYLLKAEHLISKGYPVGDLDVFEMADLIYKMEQEKKEKDSISDKEINYNDEIVSIESVGEKETIDISVSGDNLFYCNGILTKNSWGLPATADLMFALVTSEELEENQQIMVKQLKNRYNDPNKHKRFVIGVNRGKMKLHDVSEDQQTLMTTTSTPQQKDPGPVFDNTSFGAVSKDKFSDILV
jgi:hypothetical protein